MADSIVSLKGPDRVRKRPALVFGEEKATKAAKMLIAVFLTEAAWDYCRRIDVRLHADGGVAVCGSGRGIVLDNSDTEAGKPLWEHLFCDLHAAPACPDEAYEAEKRRLHSRLFGGAAEGVDTLPLVGEVWFDWCCVQYASAYMRVEAVRGGVKTVRYFREGYVDGEVSAVRTCRSDGTRISFLPDRAVFGDCAVSRDALAAFLQEWMGKIGGLQCTLCEVPYAVTEEGNPDSI